MCSNIRFQHSTILKIRKYRTIRYLAIESSWNRGAFNLIAFYRKLVITQFQHLCTNNDTQTHKSRDKKTTTNRQYITHFSNEQLSLGFFPWIFRFSHRLRHFCSTQNHISSIFVYSKSISVFLFIAFRFCFCIHLAETAFKLMYCLAEHTNTAHNAKDANTLTQRHTQTHTQIKDIPSSLFITSARHSVGMLRRCGFPLGAFSEKCSMCEFWMQQPIWASPHTQHYRQHTSASIKHAGKQRWRKNKKKTSNSMFMFLLTYKVISWRFSHPPRNTTRSWIPDATL